jgi:hypothetical protein
MIHTTAKGTPKRRIAIIAMPRPQRARMGSIGAAPPPAISWTTLSDETPDSSANWMSYTLMQQATAREATPGTLTYTPANNTPAPNVAPWNSWLSPNCPPADAAAKPKPDYTKLWLLFGGITATAGLLYIANSIGDDDDRKRR